jgi:hypothetical protein
MTALIIKFLWLGQFLIIIQPRFSENKLIFNEMMTRSILYLTNTLSWIFIVLAHWNNSPWVDMSLHSQTWSTHWS